MKRKLPKLRQINILVVTLVLLFGPLSLYYFFYFSSQKDYFVTRNFRLLSALGSGIEMKVDAIGKAYMSAAQKAAKSYGPGKCIKNDGPAVTRELKDALTPVNESQQIVSSSIKPAAPGSIANGEPTLDIKRESGAPRLVFTYVAAVEACPSVVVSAESDLDDFVAPFFRRFLNGRDLDAVFLADAKGQMLYQWSPDEVRLTNIGALMGKNGSRVDFEQLKQNGNVADVVIAENDYKLFLQPVELHSTDSQANLKWAAGGLVRTSHLMSESRAISYTVLIVITFLFILIILSLPFLKLVFMGAKDVLRVADVYFLAFATLMGSALLTAFLVFAISYADLELKMDLQLRDLSGKIIRNFDAELGDAIQELQELNLENWSDPKKKQLGLVARQFDKTADQQGHVSLSVASSHEDAGNQIDSHSPANPSGLNGCPTDLVCPGRTSILKGSTDNPYPFFTTAFWIDKDGQQRIKWTINAALPSYFPVKDRPYFKNVLADRAWEYQGNKFFVEPVYSKATGNQQVVLAMPLKLPREDRPELVSAMDIRALSLVQTVLPEALGYGYCVIDNNGKVLFHSDDSRNLVEDFFRESDNDITLRNAVQARESKAMNVQYQGASYRFFVSPVPNTSWTLVTFRDKQVGRSAGLEFVAYAIYFFCIYALALLLFFSLYYLWYREDRSALLWPNHKRAVNYHLSIGFNLVLALVFLLAIGSWDKWLVLPLTVLIPTLGLLFHHYNVRRRADFGTSGLKIRKFLRRYSPLNYRHGYVLTLVSLLMLVSVLPMIAFFTFAYDREMKLLVSLGQISLVRGIENRAERVKRQYDSLVDQQGITSDDEKQLIMKRLDLTKSRDIYGDFFFQTQVKAGASELAVPVGDASCHDAFFNWRETASAGLRADCFVAFFDSITPFQNTLTLGRRVLSGSSTPIDASGLFGRSGDEHSLILGTYGNVDGDKDHTRFTVSSVPPTLAHRWTALWRLGILVILLLVPILLFVLINFVGGRIFLLGSDEPIWHYKDELSGSALGQNLFLIASRFTRKDEALKRSGFEVVDLRSIKSARDWARLHEDNYDSKKSIAINHFESNLDDPNVNSRKIKLIEHHLAHNNTVVVASTVDLANYNFNTNGQKPDEDGDDAPNRDPYAWATFNSLRRFCLEDRGQPGAFIAKLDEYADGLKLRRRTRKVIKRHDRLLKAVKRECQSRAFLQELGNTLLKRRDFITLNPDRISWRVQDRCDAYYHALWDTCTTEEKLTLVNLANHRLVSSHNPSLPGLLRRGLIFREPFLRPMNDSFARFILAQATPERIQDWRGATEASNWEMLRVPLLIGLIVVAGFLFVSQRDLYNSSLAFVSAGAAAMPVLFKFLGMFSGGKG